MRLKNTKITSKLHWFVLRILKSSQHVFYEQGGLQKSIIAPRVHSMHDKKRAIEHGVYQHQHVNNIFNNNTALRIQGAATLLLKLQCRIRISEPGNQQLIKHCGVNINKIPSR
jgi:hypothetical protein